MEAKEQLLKETVSTLKTEKQRLEHTMKDKFTEQKENYKANVEKMKT